jgi:hypothetical protein
MGRTTFAKTDPTMQRCFGFLMELIFVGYIVSSSFDVAFVFALSVLCPSLFSQCCVFVFGCAHNNLFASLCFRRFFFFCCACSNVDASSCFEGFYYCCLFVNFSFNIFYHLMLLYCAIGFNIISMFMFHCVISMGSIQLQLYVHHKCCCITIIVASLIPFVPTLPIFLDVMALQLFLHRHFFTSHVITLQLLLHCWFFYSMESNYFSTSCVVSNYCVFMFFVGFSILWLQPHKHRVGDCVLQRCIPFFLSGSICFVVCIDFNVNQFCFIEFGVHFQFVFLWHKCLCVYNHEHCSMKYFFPLVFVLLYNV